MTTMTKRTRLSLTATERLGVLDAEFDSLIAAGADSKELQKVSDDIGRVQAEVAAEAKTAREIETRTLKIKRAQVAAEQNRKLAAAKEAGGRVDTGTVVFTLDGKPLVTVRIIPAESVGQFQAGDHEVSRAAIGIIWNAVERFSHNRMSNTRSHALGVAPTLDDDPKHLLAMIRDSARAAIARGLITVHE